MTDIFWMDKVIELQNYIDFNDILQMKDRGPVVSLWPEEGKLSKVSRTYQSIKSQNQPSIFSNNVLVQNKNVVLRHTELNLWALRVSWTDLDKSGTFSVVQGSMLNIPVMGIMF